MKIHTYTHICVLLDADAMRTRMRRQVAIKQACQDINILIHIYSKLLGSLLYICISMYIYTHTYTCSYT